MNSFFSQNIIQWYHIHHRDLPWRETNDPYKIWVSEIILQQTRVVQGMDYYHRFLHQFPTVKDLAEASEDEVLLVWQGLGYYSRARNMHQAAKDIMTNHQGIFPSSYKDIRDLKGVGDYTAAAIASFAFHLPYAVLDGNVFRILSRCFSIHTSIDSVAGKKEFAQLSQSLLDPKQPALHNQALMDLGATICLPSSPKCQECPLNEHCLSLANKETDKLPVKAKQLKHRDRFFLYLVVKEDNTYYLHKRTNNDIWKGLYEFPLIELEVQPNNDCPIELLRPFEKDFTNLSLGKQYPPIKHILSHQNIHAYFWEATGHFLHHKESTYIPVTEDQLSDYAVSRLTEIYLSTK